MNSSGMARGLLSKLPEELRWFDKQLSEYDAMMGPLQNTIFRHSGVILGSSPRRNPEVVDAQEVMDYSVDPLIKSEEGNDKTLFRNRPMINEIIRTNKICHRIGSIPLLVQRALKNPPLP